MSTRQNLRNGLSFTELAEIIKIAGESGVKRLSIADMVTIDYELPEPTTMYETIPEQDVLETIEEIAHNEEDRKDSAIDMDESIAELMLTDPEAYEDLQTKGDILDG